MGEMLRRVRERLRMGDVLEEEIVLVTEVGSGT